MTERNPVGSLLKGLIQSLLRDMMAFVMAFAIGTIVAGALCLYYGLPLVLALGGGFLVLGLALAFSLLA